MEREGMRDLRLVLGPRYERSKLGNGAPTRADAKYTSLGCSPTIDTNRLRIVLARYEVRQPECATSNTCI